MTNHEHLLTCLAEECNEVAKICSKSLRFGIDDVNILNPHGPTNRVRLINELNDLLAVAGILVIEGILPADWQNKSEQWRKQEQVARFMLYAKDKGTLK